MEKEYAQAVATMSRSEGRDEATLVSGLVKHLQATGRVKLLPGIVRELRRISARNEKLGTTLEVATKADEAKAVAALKELGITAPAASVNPSLIRGWRARAHGQLIDHSAKSALLTIYKKITN